MMLQPSVLGREPPITVITGATGGIGRCRTGSAQHVAVSQQRRTYFYIKMTHPLQLNGRHPAMAGRTQRRSCRRAPFGDG